MAFPCSNHFFSFLCVFRFSFFLLRSQKNSRNPYVDIFVAVVTVPTLILLALLLDANIHDNIDSNETRSSFIVLIFGFGFLVLSLLVCGCIVHKMGMCRWNQPADDDQISGYQTNSSEPDIHVIDLPPSYETITKGFGIEDDEIAKTTEMVSPPPPTYEMACEAEKRASTSIPIVSNHI